RTLVAERVAEFRNQVARRLSGELTEDEFKPLRLMNGVYLQLHAYMLRVAIPYGTLSSQQLRALAHVARRYDRNYCPLTNRPHLATCHSLETSSKSCQTPGRTSPAQACMACRPAGIACGTSRPTNGLPSPPTRSKIHASGPRSCASISRCTRSSRSSRASSRS